MANSNELKSWFIENFEFLNFTSIKLNWVNDFYLPHTDICSELTINDHKLIGRGTDLSGDTALLKSFSE
jgi:hypothetical protein